MPDSELDDFLAHFGVRGMKWGQHRAEKVGPGGKTRSQLKALDAKARSKPKTVRTFETEKNRVEQDKGTLKARDKLPQSYENMRAAKEKYKVDRHKIGKVAAKNVLRDHKAVHMDVVRKANRETTHEEVTRILKEHGEMLTKAIYGTTPAERRAKENAENISFVANGAYNMGRKAYEKRQATKQSTPKNGGHYTATPNS